MQKARRHHTQWLRPLAGAWFQVLFHSPVRGSFHLSLTVLCAIGLSVVFSLSGWSPIIRPEFLVFRLTQVAVLAAFSSVTGLSPSTARHSSRFSSITSAPLSAPITPARALRHRRFGLFPVRSPLLGESLLLSLPVGTKMFQVPAFAHCFAVCRDRSRRVPPFGHPRISGYLLLPAAFRSLSRPSSPPRA